MRNILIYCLLLPAGFLQSALYAQQVKYSSTPMREGIKIAGYFGNTIHAWSMPLQTPNEFTTDKTILTLHIFSKEMKLLAEKNFSLGKSLIKKIDFQIAAPFYYVQVIYETTGTGFRIYKVDVNGNADDVTNIPGLWKEDSLPAGSEQLHQVAVNTTNRFEVKNANATAGNTPDADKLIFINNESVNTGKIFQKLTIEKRALKNDSLITQQIYATGYINFFRLFCNATDTTVSLWAFGHPDNGTDRQKRDKSSYLFLAKLDTNLSAFSNGTSLLKINLENKNELYTPNNVYTADKNTFIVCKGQDKTRFNNPSGITGYPYSPVNGKIGNSNSLKIMLIDENNHFLLDTVFESKNGREYLNWNNAFVIATNAGINIFCLHRYRAGRNGITLFSINKNGGIVEKEMIVREDYLYDLEQAYTPAPGVLIVPYYHNKTNGIMRLNYESAE